MARSEWDEICPKCKGEKEIEEEKHGKVSRKTCPKCRGTGELDPKELTRRLDLAEKQLGKRII